MRLSSTRASITSSVTTVTSGIGGGGQQGGGGGGGLAAFNQAELSFRYHMRGSAMGIIWVFWESGGTYTQLFVKAGEQHQTSTQAWTFHGSGTDLHNKDGETGNIVIIGQKQSSSVSNNFRTDMSLCELSITTQSGTVTLNDYQTEWKTGTSQNSTLDQAKAQATTAYLTLESGTVANVWRRATALTPSSGTGPDKHHDDNSNSEYMFFEGSNAGNALMSTLRTASTITL